MARKQVSSSLFGDTVQPESLSLFSSTSSHPFALWKLHTDPDLVQDSGICLLVDASDELVPCECIVAPAALQLRVEPTPRGSCSETVLHIQSPAIRDTWICSPPSDEDELGIQLPCIAFQYRRVGSCRPFSIQVGVKDIKGQEGVIRVSTFQSEPKLHLELPQDANPASHKDRLGSSLSRPILHLPLTAAATPDQDETSLTSWQVLMLPIDRLVEHLSDSSLTKSGISDLTGRGKFRAFHSITQVKIFGNVRLRRIWCSRDPPDHDLPEFQMFS